MNNGLIGFYMPNEAEITAKAHVFDVSIAAITEIQFDKDQLSINTTSTMRKIAWDIRCTLDKLSTIRCKCDPSDCSSAKHGGAIHVPFHVKEHLTQKTKDELHELRHTLETLHKELLDTFDYLDNIETLSQ
jgi:hypothetical protein